MTGPVARGTPLFALLLSCATCGPEPDVPMDFCTTLRQDDRPALRDAVNEYLSGLSARETLSARLERLRQWIAAQPCVTAAELDPTLLDTEPPIQQVRVRVEGEDTARSLGIVLDPDRLRSNLR